jgi:hypothetical protein
MPGFGTSFAPRALIVALALLAACQSQSAGGDGAGGEPPSSGGKGGGGSGGKGAGGVAGKGAGGSAVAGGAGGQSEPSAGGAAAADASVPAASDGGADSAPPAGLSAFVGRWVYESGQESLACMGKPPQANSLAGIELVIAAGKDSPLTLANEACSFALDVAGNVASARPGQTCKLADGASMLVYALTSLTFTVEGPTAMETSSWSIDFIDPSGNLRCPYTTIGRLRKLP